MDKTEVRVTTSHAARIIGVSSSRIIQLANEGRLAVEQTPLGRLFDRAEVERFAAERRHAAGQEQPS